MITINDLNKTEATLYRSYVKANSLDVNQQKAIDTYCSEGKQGHAKIISIVELMKANNESVAKIKTQVSRAFKKLDVDLSLQPGKKDEDVQIAPKQANVNEVKATKAPKPEDTVEANTKKYDIEDLEDVFFGFSRDTQQVELMVLIEGSKLLKKDKKALIALLDIEVLKIAK